LDESLAAFAGRLRRLEDRAAIRALLVAIARGTDRYDPALLESAICPDAVLDMGGAAPLSGAAFAAALKPPAAPRPGRMHIVTNERIDLDGDIARSETYVLSCQDVLVDGVRKTRLRAGRYLDRFERRNGSWKLAARTLVDEWGRIDAVGESIPQGPHLGRPAPDDLSYLEETGE
jgi:hypothetical protein